MAIYLSDITGATQTLPFHDDILVWTSNPVVTADRNKGYFVDTTAGARSVALPTDPKDGDQVAFIDTMETFATNNLIVTRSGYKIMGLEEDMTVSTDKATFKMVFNETDGDWRLSYVTI